MDAEVGVDVAWIRGGVCCCVPGGVGAGEGGAGAPCVFQRLRLGGKALDGELARLVPWAVLTSARTDAVSPLRARAFPPAPLSLKAEFRPRTTLPLCTTSAFALPSHPPSAQSMSAKGRFCSQTPPESWSVSAGGHFCSPAPLSAPTLAVNRFCQTAAHHTTLIAPESRAHVRGRSICGVGAP